MYRSYVKKSLPRDELKHVNRHAPEELKYCNFLCQDYRQKIEFTSSDKTICNNCLNTMNMAKKHINENKYTIEDFIENPNLAVEEGPVVLTKKDCTNCKQSKFLTEYDINKNYCKSCRLIQSKTRNADITNELKDIETLKTNFVELERFLRKVAKDKLIKIVSHHSVGRSASDSKDKIVLNIVLHFKKLTNPHICRGGCGYILSEPLSTCNGCKKTRAKTKRTITEFKEEVLPGLLETLKSIERTDDHLYNLAECYALAVALGCKPTTKSVKSEIVEMINKKLEFNREEKKKNEATSVIEIQVKECIIELNGIIANSRSSDGYINATQLCKAGGKTYSHWIENKGVNDLITELESDIGYPRSQLINTIKGGNSKLQGSWIHPDLAVQLAQWISPKFAIQVSRWVREIALTGTVVVGKEKSEEKLLQLLNERDAAILILQDEVKSITKNHNKLLKKRTHHQFLKGPSVYLTTDQECTVTKRKIGETDDINDRLQTYRTNVPSTKIEFLLYSPDAALIEQTILKRFEDQREFINHEVVYNISKEDVISSILTYCDFANIPYKIDDTIEKYNEEI